MNHTASPQSEFLRGIKETSPMLIGLLPWALILGMQGGQKGMSWLEMLLMTGMNFAGGSEFAAVNLWANPLPILLIATVTFMINSRHILMGAAIAPYMRDIPLKKAMPALFVMCDESWAMAFAEIQKRKAAGLPAFNMPFYAGVCFILYVMWIGFAAFGAAVGPMFGDVAAWGFGMAFPAVFLVLLRGMWKSFAASRPWFVSLIVACVTYLTVDGAWYVPAGALSGLLAAYFLGRAKMKDLLSLQSFLLFLSMLAVTYSTRLIGFFALRNRTLSRRAQVVMEAAPGCVLISVIAPYFVSDKPHELIAIALTVLAASRFSMLVTVLIGVGTSGILGYLMK